MSYFSLVRFLWCDFYFYFFKVNGFKMPSRSFSQSEKIKLTISSQMCHETLNRYWSTVWVYLNRNIKITLGRQPIASGLIQVNPNFESVLHWIGFQPSDFTVECTHQTKVLSHITGLSMTILNALLALFSLPLFVWRWPIVVAHASGWLFPLQ